MVEYEKRYEEVCCLGFYFEDDQKFVDFLNTIEKFGKIEINYYNVFKQILRRIKHGAGVPDNYRPDDRLRDSFLPAPAGRNITVKYKLKWNEDHTKPYMICEIEVKDNATLKDWNNTRY